MRGLSPPHSPDMEFGQWLLATESTGSPAAVQSVAPAGVQAAAPAGVQSAAPAGAKAGRKRANSQVARENPDLQPQKRPRELLTQAVASAAAPGEATDQAVALLRHVYSVVGNNCSWCNAEGVMFRPNGADTTGVCDTCGKAEHGEELTNRWYDDERGLTVCTSCMHRDPKAEEGAYECLTHAWLGKPGGVPSCKDGWNCYLAVIENGTESILTPCLGCDRCFCKNCLDRDFFTCPTCPRE